MVERLCGVHRDMASLLVFFSCVCGTAVKSNTLVQEMPVSGSGYAFPFTSTLVSRLKEISKRSPLQGGYHKPKLGLLDSPEKQYDLKVGDSVVLHCSAGGHPLPSIYWTRNHDMLTEEFFYGRSYMFPGSGLVHQFPVTGMSTTESRLYVDCAQPADAGNYACVAETPLQRLHTNSKITVSNRGGPEPCVPPTEPRIVLWTSLYVDLQGQDALLACKAEGDAPVIWRDSSGRQLKSSRKFKVTKTGELVIRRLSWEDMGSYVCQAADGEDAREAFVYPLSEQDDPEALDGKLR